MIAMKNLKIFGVISILASSMAMLSSCGETFTGRFGGNGIFRVENCPPQIQRLEGRLEVRLTISGDEAEISVLDMTGADGARINSLALTGLKRQVSLSNDTSLNGSRSNNVPEEMESNNLYPIRHSISGNVATDRQVIDNLSLTMDTVDATHTPESPCRMNIQATHLEFID